MVKFLMHDNIRNSIFNEITTADYKKIENEEEFNVANEKIKNSVGYKVVLTNIFKRSINVSKGCSSSIKDALKASIDPDFLVQLGWLGTNSIKFEGTAFCELLISKLFLSHYFLL